MPIKFKNVAKYLKIRKRFTHRKLILWVYEVVGPWCSQFLKLSKTLTQADKFREYLISKIFMQSGRGSLPDRPYLRDFFSTLVKCRNMSITR